MNGRWAMLALRVGVAAVFVYAGVVKAPQPQRFALDIESYQLASPVAAQWVALYLPYLEIAAGLGLLVNRVALGAVLMLGGLTAIFTVALTSAWARGLEIRCGCFGAGDAPAAQYAWWILRDALLLAACVILWRSLAGTRAMVDGDANQRP